MAISISIRHSLTRTITHSSPAPILRGRLLGFGPLWPSGQSSAPARKGTAYLRTHKRWHESMWSLYLDASVQKQIDENMLHLSSCSKPSSALPTHHRVQQRDMLKGGKESYGVAEERDREEGMGDPARAPIRSRVLMFGNHKAASGRLGTRKEGECWARHSRREREKPRPE